MAYIVKGGFPRIQVKFERIEEKKEKGFSSSKFSLKNIKTNNPKSNLQIGNKNPTNFIKVLDGGSNKTIKGVPIDIL